MFFYVQKSISAFLVDSSPFLRQICFNVLLFLSKITALATYLDHVFGRAHSGKCRAIGNSVQGDAYRDADVD